MSKIKLIETGFDDLLIIEVPKFGDARGYFSETYNYRDLKSSGVDIQFVQDNQSKSSRGVIRGLHFQNAPYAQTKLVRVLSGSILDVVLDLRRDKKTFGKIFQLEMSAEKAQQLLVPKGFAHGFIVLSSSAELLYKTDEFHFTESEGGILFNDPALNIDWKIPFSEMIISDRDKKHPKFADAKFNF
ncbi:MAG: dTDP-4-dehydrorhamnose 3,5-epimerase [Bacteroidetes bacterium]|nr:dTDP-4-dehydrorhamnose 3,5-epimerase [Bacteroidota bacterium]MBI3482886.1 dTDP-4-dehydrorhamnose 3,5-epimerase [Bacteroidota bacterium]